MGTVFETIRSIEPVDREILALAKKRQDSLAKPPESLGKLEDISVKLAAIAGEQMKRQGTRDSEEKIHGTTPEEPWHSTIGFRRGCVLVFCADNGVVQQGVASAPPSVTRAQTINFTRRLTGVGALANSYGSELLVVDVGVKDPIPEELYCYRPFENTRKILDRRIRPGTRDISEGPAMTMEEAEKAMETGIEIALAAEQEGYEILGVGEMGIGNTTTSAAVLSALTGRKAEETCGRGGGVNEEGFRRKRRVVHDASASFRKEGFLKNRESLREEDLLEYVLTILSRCGGFDLCAMTGAYLGAAAKNIPVVMDGYISVVAALAATTIKPAVRDYLFASHQSVEPGYKVAIDLLGQEPFLHLDMRLGEGSGCPIAFAVLQGAWDVLKNMGTFQEAEIDDRYLEEIRREKGFRE